MANPPLRAMKRNPLLLMRRRKAPVAATRRASAVAGYDAEMIGSVCSQPAEVGTHALICVSCVSLRGSYGPVVGRCPVLKTYDRTQSVGGDWATERGGITFLVCRRVRRNDRRSRCAKCSKAHVAATHRTSAVGSYDPEMGGSIRSKPTDIRTDVLVSVPLFDPGAGQCPVAGCCPVLKMYGRAQSMRID